MNLLEVSGLRTGYGAVPVIHGIDFAVEEGEIAVILGANGAGKTTILRALSGMLPRGGQVAFDGRDVCERSTSEMVRLGVAHVPQGRGTFVDLTVEDNLLLGAYVRRNRGVRVDVKRWYERFPRLGERRRQTAGSLSGGEQQMLAIARALMLRPRLLLCDEPSLGLAPVVTRELFTTLAEINASDGTSMLVVEQEAALALGIARRGYVVEAGSITTSGPAAALSADDAVRRAYLGV